MKPKNKLLLVLLLIVLLLIGLALLLNRLGTRSGATDAQVSETLPGDSVFPDPWISIDRSATLPVSAQTAWPWVAQLGYQRGGWYAPLWLENTLHLYSASSTLPQFQDLSVGEVVPDFGGGKLKVLAVVPDEYVVYGSLPHTGTASTTTYNFTWALVLENDMASSTSFHLRLRIPRPAKPTWIPPSLPGLIDYATDAVMFAGLKEQLQKHLQDLE
jgi:hypothetical protein